MKKPPPSDQQLEYRKRMSEFGRDMLKKIEDQKNMNKGDWRNIKLPNIDDDEDLIKHYHSRLIDEVDELWDAIAVAKRKGIIAECADVANFAMFIADIARISPLLKGVAVKENNG